MKLVLLIKPFLDRDKVLKDFIERKEYNVDKVLPAYELMISNYKQIALMKQMEFEMSSVYSYEVLSEMNDKELLSHVGEYLNKQLTSGFVKNQVFIKVPDRVLVLILNALVRVGDYAKADKILKLRKNDSNVLSDELKQVQQLINEVRKTVCYFEDRRLYPEEVASLEEMKPIVLQLLQDNPRQLNLHRCVLEL